MIPPPRAFGLAAQGPICEKDRHMKAIRLIQPGHRLEACEAPLPPLGRRDVLVQVCAAGICHSDVHYRAGRSRVEPLPLTLGHEVAGLVQAVGAEVTTFRPGDRVCLHYLATCGECLYCQQGHEQFCRAGAMIGKYRDGGYAEFIVMPARSVFSLPAEISFEHGAILMCSSATSLHALRKARLAAGESVAIFGVSDHLAQELPLLLEWTRLGKLDLSKVVTRTIALEESAVNEALDHLSEFGADARVVIIPQQPAKVAQVSQPAVSPIS